MGKQRINIGNPLAESGIAGTAVGMAASGLKPIIEMQFSGFSYHAFHQIINQVSRIRNRSRGRHTAPIVIRMPYGGGIKAPEHHSESMEVLYAAIPGLKVVIPSIPHDAKGLLIDAVRGEDPVVFMEPKRFYRSVKQEVQEEEYSIPIGKAAVGKEGETIDVDSPLVEIKMEDSTGESSSEKEPSPADESSSEEESFGVVGTSDPAEKDDVLPAGSDGGISRKKIDPKKKSRPHRWRETTPSSSALPSTR